jgi:hypothetical protein
MDLTFWGAVGMVTTVTVLCCYDLGWYVMNMYLNWRNQSARPS